MKHKEQPIEKVAVSECGNIDIANSAKKVLQNVLLFFLSIAKSGLFKVIFQLPL